MRMKLPSNLFVLLLGLCYFRQVHSAALFQGNAFVLSAARKSDGILERHRRSSGQKTSISSLHITSVVMSRFARVTVVSEMQNHLNESKDITFLVRLPEAAFITEFQMEVSGVTFVGKIKEKEAAKKQFEQALQSGNTAGLVTADVRETQTFNVQANVAAQSSATFTLVYQELLKRRLGEYNHVILINPGQVVSDLVVDVYITEKLAITSLNVGLPNSNTNVRGKSGSYSTIPVDYDIRRSKQQAKITFKPSEIQQRQLMLIPEDERKLTVRYDVTREVFGGEIQTRNGYFVHFFAPENLPIFPKNVVFVIDRSGSMWGTKMEQTKKAFKSVLKEMRETDRFNIISFAGDITAWKSAENLVKVDKENVEDAIDYVKNIVASGATNINDAMTKAAELLTNSQDKKRTSSMIILLTDGDPTAGVVNTEQIRLNVKRAVDGRFSVFCLGFGEYLNHDFLKRMASENDGISRQIYEDSDADLQLEGFFQEVATPLLLHFEIKYLGSEVENVTKSKFDKYFSGSEVVVVGKVASNEKNLRTVIRGESVGGKVAFRVKNTPQEDSFQHWFKDTGNFDDFIERLWAYFTIKELLQQREILDSPMEINELNDEIIHLALKYSFVTPLTSMVVTLPEDDITTASPTGSTIHPPIPPCFMRGSDLPPSLISPPIWCPRVLTEGEVEAQDEDWMVQPSFSFSSPPQFSSFQMGPPGPPQRSRGRIMGGPVHSNRIIAVPIHTTRYIPKTRSTTTTIPTTTTTTTMASPPECNQLLKGPKGRIESLSDVVSGKTLCKWKIVVEEGSWINLHLEKMDTAVNQIDIMSDNAPIYSHLYGSSPEKYFLLSTNVAHVHMALYPADNDKPPMVVTYEEYIPGGPKTQNIALSSEHVFDEEMAHTVISSSVNKTGFIASPNYPMPYPSNSHSLWIFNNADPNLQLRFTFLDMDIEMNGDGSCTHDKIVIMDGDNERDLCGYDLINGSWSTTEEKVKIAFVSDDKLETSGFKMKYQFGQLSI